MWAGGYLRRGEEGPPPSPAAEGDPFALPEVAPAPFRNASQSVGYVGTGECVGCHRPEHETYLRTTHSRSMGDVDVAREPPDGEVRHDLSGRGYRVYRDGGALRLREFVRDADGQEVVLVDHPARFGLGSNNHSRLYLVKDGDFMVESPVTWYPRRNAWGMSAGYEKDPHQRGFNRSIDAGCLFCHAGRVEQIGDAGERVRVLDPTIGCERCHGPGELHVRERTAQRPVRGGGDDTIVNLRRLPREAQEDVCAQCHLSSAADVAVRGRGRADFRPGMRMSDFVVIYRVDRADTTISVSGQVEQMRASRCYRESKTLTCATCHDPHGPPDAAREAQHYRTRCLTCHAPAACRLPVQARTEKEPGDYCVACHMPRSPTDIPHLSFTHHRIGVHLPKPDDRLTAADRLVPVADVSYFPEPERQRLLGLADVTFAAKLAGGLNDEVRYDPGYRALSKVFHDRGRQLLEDVRSKGLRDAEVEDFFARTHWRKHPALCVEHAEAALRAGPASPSVRKSALYNLATSYFDQGRYDAALPYLEELVRCERNEITMMLLAICYQKKGNLPEAVRLVTEAIRVAPERADLHDYLATVYREMGKTPDAERHLQRAKLLRLKVPQPG